MQAKFRNSKLFLLFQPTNQFLGIESPLLRCNTDPYMQMPPQIGNSMDVDRKQAKPSSGSLKVSSVEEGISSLVQMCNDSGLESHFTTGQTAYHHSLNRFQKALEHEYPPVIPSNPLQSIQLSSSSTISLVSAYLLRTGRIEMAKQLSPDLSPSEVAPYEQLRSLIIAVRERDVNIVLDWISTAQEQLDNASLFDLTFKLRKLHYGNLIKSKATTEALAYAQAHFHPYMSEHREEMHKLLGALAFLPSIEDPAYRGLVGSTVLMKTEELLGQLFCRANRLPSDAHLLTLVRASSHAIPSLSKALALSSSMNVSNGQANGAHAKPTPTILPFEIPLPKDFIFHSLFCCPVSKELSTPENPPQLLPCGHVLSKDIVSDLARGRASYRSAHPEPVHPFKCPYCPEKVQVSQVKTLKFD